MISTVANMLECTKQNVCDKTEQMRGNFISVPKYEDV